MLPNVEPQSTESSYHVFCYAILADKDDKKVYIDTTGTFLLIAQLVEHTVSNKLFPGLNLSEADTPEGCRSDIPDGDG